ncbi:hypothetical protein PACTADRAFT_73523 [Pachysolen tannophilus NRRL Y-2460]|uniref:Increased recombination centers protein 6 n=1 Tax=Pachysolen tannophilus NRRL Y-2460 TaxID=669874 RepID=A0A1E4U1G2_PACTA|nr:hypothetical protein PACTADRAFT_73523 [Pachysolen tannophilus NRRL Y-2460]
MNNQVLIVGAPHTGKLTLLKELFGVDFKDYNIENDSHSGVVINDIEIKTKYYTTKIGFWIDEFQERGSSAGNDIEDFAEWCRELSSPSMREIREVLKGLIFTFNMNADLAQISKKSEHLYELIEIFNQESVDNNNNNNDSNDSDVYGWEGLKIAIGFNKDKVPISEKKLIELDDIFLNNGFEFVWFEEPQSLNNDSSLIGKERVRNILETNDWSNITTSNKNKATTQTTDEDIQQMLTRLLSSDTDTNTDNDNNIEKTEIKTEKDESKVDYIELLEKLKNAKLTISTLDNEQNKMDYAKKILSDVVKYI